MKRIDLSLSFSDTNVLKGVAVLLLLCHHLFFQQKGLYDDIILDNSYDLVHQIGINSKLCVGLFVFLSGYGLVKSIANRGGHIKLLQFYKNRFAKLFLNYWLIYLLFVPIGVFLLGRSFEFVYGSEWVFKAILDFFGLHYAVTGNMMGYNPTWWFYGCIIVLYLLFPFLYCIIRRWYLLIVFALVTYLYGWQVPFFSANCGYIVSFIGGMLLAYNVKSMPQLPSWVICTGYGLLPILFIARNFSIWTLWYELLIIMVLILLYKQKSYPQYICSALDVLGKHSFNIFLFHTFFLIYWPQWVYFFRNPILLFSLFVLICLGVSFMIEKLKALIGFNRISAFICKQ